MKVIKPIYNQIQFRSRLEARWAIFLDKLAIDYRYCTKFVELENGEKYRPSFKLLNLNCWFDVERRKITVKKKEKAYLLSLLEDIDVFIACGWLAITRGSWGESPQVSIHGFSGDWENPRKTPLIELGPFDFESELFENLAQYLSKKCGQEITYDGTINSAKNLIELDSKLYFEKYKEKHCRWPYGRYYRDLFWHINESGEYCFSHWPQEEVHPRIKEAYQAATRARFEHGQTPKGPND